MASDLDRRCNQILREKEAEIERISTFLDHIYSLRWHITVASNTRLNQIGEYRNSCIIDLYETQKAHKAYDAALDSAREDPTGQDVDRFYEQYSENDEPIKPEY